jgi:hypothetical protein
MNKFCENLRVQREICLIFFKQLGIRFRNDLPTKDTKKIIKFWCCFRFYAVTLLCVLCVFIFALLAVSENCLTAKSAKVFAKCAKN